MRRRSLQSIVFAASSKLGVFNKELKTLGEKAASGHFHAHRAIIRMGFSLVRFLY